MSRKASGVGAGVEEHSQPPESPNLDRQTTLALRPLSQASMIRASLRLHPNPCRPQNPPVKRRPEPNPNPNQQRNREKQPVIR